MNIEWEWLAFKTPKKYDKRFIKESKLRTAVRTYVPSGIGYGYAFFAIAWFLTTSDLNWSVELRSAVGNATVYATSVTLRWFSERLWLRVRWGIDK